MARRPATPAQQRQPHIDPGLVAMVEALPPKDAKYLSDLMEKIYAGEIDRKDKILASMTILGAPATLLLGAISFLINNLIDYSDEYIRNWSDLVVLSLVFFALCALVFLGRAIWYFSLLLSGENYTYMPYANAMLNSVLEMKDYLNVHVTRDDGYLSWYSEAMRIPLFAMAATTNGIANEQRTQHRQRVFRNLFRTIGSAALSFIMIGLHREAPHGLTVLHVWTYAHGFFS